MSSSTSSSTLGVLSRAQPITSKPQALTPKYPAVSGKENVLSPPAISPKPITPTSVPSREASVTIRRSSASPGSTMTSSLNPVSALTVKPKEASGGAMKANSPILATAPSNMKPTNSKQPTLIMKDSGSSTVPKLSTSKVWVLPPRPKPGRKPSTDTPATKRKAQNRAAQRAFRERRATRVVELEELLADVQNERDLREQQLNDTLKNVSAENNELRQSLEELRVEMKLMRQQQQLQLQQMQLQQNIQQEQANSLLSSHTSIPAFTSYGSTVSPGDTTTASLNSFNFKKSHASQSSLHQHKAYHRGSIGSNHGSPASGIHSYPPAMDQIASPAPSVESPLDALDRILEMRLPVPNNSSSDNTPANNKTNSEISHTDAQLSVMNIANMTNNINDNSISNVDEREEEEEEDDGCGVCVKEDCICESLGIRQPRTKSNVSTPAATPSDSAKLVQTTRMVSLPSILETVTSAQVHIGQSVPIKRKKGEAANSDIPFFKKLKRNPDARQPVTSVLVETDNMEMDFTSQFAKPKPNKRKVGQPTGPSVSIKARQAKSSSNATSVSIKSILATSSSNMNDSSHNAGTPVDPCGFCSDGTPCLCAENASEEAKSMADLIDDGTPLPPISFSTTDTLAPINSTSASGLFSQSRNGSLATDNRMKLPPIIGSLSNDNLSSSGCTGNPGTCFQCRSDPMSTLFCTTLASRVSAGTRVSSDRSSLSKESPTSGNSATKGEKCCGGDHKHANGDENHTPLRSSSSTQVDQFVNGSQEASSSSSQVEPSDTSSARTYIPCSAAYQTLSRHKDFRRVDLGKLVGRLTTKGMQVEVSSVANVLRELDRRLYE